MLNAHLTPFTLWKDKRSKTAQELKDQLAAIGLELEIETGHLFYSAQFKPLIVQCELIFVCHGETFGNAGQSTSNGEIDYELVKNNIKNSEKRIYEGDMDNEINQLTEVGLKQAQGIAEKLNSYFLKKDWEPNIILISPLKRAVDTASSFIEKNNFQGISFIHEDIKEISFGSWNNRRVCDMHPDNPCHLFYRKQHALVKDLTRPSAENFCDILLRAYRVLREFNNHYPNKRILMFSHVMFGTACCVLLGKGQKIENGGYLAFDGRRKDGTYYTIGSATPFLLTSKLKM